MPMNCSCDIGELHIEAVVATDAEVASQRAAHEGANNWLTWQQWIAIVAQILAAIAQILGGGGAAPGAAPAPKGAPKV